MNTDLPRIPCPLCESCDHDMRGSLLDLLENIGQNLKDAGEVLLDAIEEPGPAAARFLDASRDLIGVRRQLDALLDVVPDVAQIKAVNHS